MDKEVKHWVEVFGMQAHPEGGYFAETYRSEEKIGGETLPERYQGVRNAGTAIYFLIPAGQCSSFHQLQSDEIWHFYTGGPLSIYVIDEQGKLDILKIGPEGPFQVLVPRGTWFGAKPDGNRYSLVGCTMSPGFDFQDFALGKREELISLYPQHEKLIRELT